MADNTPPRGVDFSKADFANPDVVRDSYRYLDAIGQERFDEYLRIEAKRDERLFSALEIIEQRSQARANDVADAIGMVIRELGKNSGVLERIALRVERLDQERELPLIKLEKIERANADRDAEIIKLWNRSPKVPNPEESGAWLAQQVEQRAQQALELSNDLADDRIEAIARASKIALEEARAGAVVLVEREEQKAASMRRKQIVATTLASILLLIVGTILGKVLK